MTTEIWKFVPGWEDLYEVSDHGRVRSLPRQTARGVRGGKMLQLVPGKRDYLTVSFSVESRVTRVWVHQLVLLAFVGPRPDGMEVAHEDGDQQNNILGNLSYKTKSGNMLDSVRHGTHRNSKKTECPVCGGPYSKNGRGQRVCLACRNATQRATYAADPAAAEKARAARYADLENRRRIERESKRRRRAAAKADAT